MADLEPIEGEYDYIIVGAGSAGCLLANRLERLRVIDASVMPRSRPATPMRQP